MRDHRRLWAITAVVISGGAFACVGGGGPLSDGMSTWDPSPSSLERAENTREPAPGFREVAPSSRETVGASAEPGPGAQGGGGAGAGGLDCSGTYRCVEEGDDDVDEVTLVSANGVCFVPAGGNAVLVLGPDGSLLLNGQSVGSWQATAGGFVATSEDGTVTCTKGGGQGSTGTGGGGGTGGGDGSGGGGGNGSGGNRPPVVRDAGG